jgi:hypothetical protein
LEHGGAAAGLVTLLLTECCQERRDKMNSREEGKLMAAQTRISKADPWMAGEDAGRRFYEAVLRSGFSMEPSWPNPIARHAMSDSAMLERLEQGEPAQAGHRFETRLAA